MYKSSKATGSSDLRFQYRTTPSGRHTLLDVLLVFVFVSFLPVLPVNLLEAFARSFFFSNRTNLCIKVNADTRTFPGWDFRLEDDFDLLERLALGLGIHEEDVEGHDKAEDAEDDICFPDDVGEGGSDEKGERKVEARNGLSVW